MMNRFTLPGLIFLLSTSGPAFPAAARFEKVTDHCYWWQLQPDGPGVAAVVTESSVLLVNVPAQPELAEVLTALKRVTSKPVNWVINTDYNYARNGGSGELAKQGAVVLESKELRRLTAVSPRNDSVPPPARAGDKPGSPEEKKTDAPERMIFGRQMRLFPDNLEIRILAVQSKAHTAGDLVLFLPAEKVLIVGDLFTSDSYPQIDHESGEGTALGWLDGMRQVIEAVPVLKSAMPQPKPDPAKPPPEEKTLEELITVIPGRGIRSNLQEMKNLYESSNKLRNEISRAVGAGRNRESVLAAPALDAYRSFGNLDSFAGRLFDELAAQKAK